ncbi:hypothetical protein U1Q18_049197 [Sarracenia purpurea var. burkii]
MEACKWKPKPRDRMDFIRSVLVCACACDLSATSAQPSDSLAFLLSIVFYALKTLCKLGTRNKTAHFAISLLDYRFHLVVCRRSPALSPDIHPLLYLHVFRRHYSVSFLAISYRNSAGKEPPAP